MSTISLVYTTIGNREKAETLAKSIIYNKLAGCVNFLPIQSMYQWDEEFQEDKEIGMIIKTTEEKLPALREFITNQHPYEIPCILSFPMVISNDVYGNWIASQCK